MREFIQQIPSAQLVVSVVGNPVGIKSLKYMQDMSTASCVVTDEGEETQLEDKRDGQLYWVGKMKDGKCWMLQNLALGSTDTDTALNSSDSNVSGDWSLPAAKTIPRGDTTATSVDSWNFGKWVLATPILSKQCSPGGDGTIKGCTRYGFVDISNTANFQPTYTAAIGDWNGATVTSNTLVAVNCTAWSGSGTSKTCTAGTYDAHYLVGNWYSWNAATAGTGGTMTSGEASGSICPKGWRLPTGNTSGELKLLLAAYGVDSKLSGTFDGTTYNIAGAPLRFVRGGYIKAASGYVDYAAWYGYYWSSTPYSSNSQAYELNFVDSVRPAYANNRYLGHSVRCVAS